MTVATDVGAPGLPPGEESRALNDQWRALGRAATTVAILTSPVVLVCLHVHNGWRLRYALLVTIIEVAAFRGLVDVVFRRFIPWPSLFRTDDARLKVEDVANRRSAWFWRRFWRLVAWIVGIFTVAWIVLAFFGRAVPYADVYSGAWDALVGARYTVLGQSIQLAFLFFFNFLIFMGPMLAMGIAQIRAFEPGDAEWSMRLANVRGQAEAKEEITRIVSLWQSGERFERAGGKRERGILFLGAPGTGKTMLAKAIATGFNSPFVTIPGSGFAQTFIGLDAILVRYLARKAKRLARKWG